MHAPGSRASSTNSSLSFIGDTSGHGYGILPYPRTPRPLGVTDVLALFCHRCDGTTPAARGSRVAVGVWRSRLTPHASRLTPHAHREPSTDTNTSTSTSSLALRIRS